MGKYDRQMKHCVAFLKQPQISFSLHPLKCRIQKNQALKNSKFVDVPFKEILRAGTIALPGQKKYWRLHSISLFYLDDGLSIEFGYYTIIIAGGTEVLSVFTK